MLLVAKEFWGIEWAKKSYSKVKPHLIILSEVFPSASNEAEGPVEDFLNWLKRKNYSVDVG